MNPTPRPWTGPEHRRFVEMAHAGYCAQDIADALGRTKSAIHARAYASGLRLAHPVTRWFKGIKAPEHHVQAMRAMRQAGLTARQVSEIFQTRHRVSVGLVRKLCEPQA